MSRSADRLAGLADRWLIVLVHRVQGGDQRRFARRYRALGPLVARLRAAVADPADAAAIMSARPGAP
jgi:hypothetical protein